MNKSQAKIPKWVVTVLILIFIGFGIYTVIFLASKKTGEEGCFSFNDGTIQGWTLDQLYDIDLNQSQIIKDNKHNTSQVKIPYEPFKLSNNPDELLALASVYQVPDSAINNCLFYFVSPELSDNPDWQNITGFRFDITRNFTSTSGDWYGHKVFAEIIVENESGDEEILFENFIDPDKKSYLNISNLGIPYYYRCIPVELSDGIYTIKQLRIGCILIGYNFNPNIQFNGSWELTNVCPVY
ncbi:MAG: hypothetical protein K8R74_11830 [Bacteroidales bacterium]|nr:hypothetical protein [Bacteroidales bacterium]